MRLDQSFLVLGTLLARTNAQPSTTIPTSTSFSNSSSTSRTSATTPVCCFVAQETANAFYWPVTTYETTTREVNLTSRITLITPHENGTEETNSYTQITATNATFSAPFDGGVNPLRFYDNRGQNFPEQTQTKLNGNITAIETGATRV